jgi:hypothetical protein
MASAAEGAGLALPATLLAASSSPSFDGATSVTGFVVLAYSTDGGPLQQCVVTKQFDVG